MGGKVSNFDRNSFAVSTIKLSSNLVPRYFGNNFLDKGHSLLPEPYDRITEQIFISNFNLKIHKYI